jgi:hypothetical protein
LQVHRPESNPRSRGDRRLSASVKLSINNLLIESSHHAQSRLQYPELETRMPTC